MDELGRLSQGKDIKDYSLLRELFRINAEGMLHYTVASLC